MTKQEIALELTKEAISKAVNTSLVKGNKDAKEYPTLDQLAQMIAEAYNIILTKLND